MIICAAGDTHGALDRFYADVLAFEAQLGCTFAHVLHVGDFGIWPDHDRLDRATRDRDGAGDFKSWLDSGRSAPRPTTFIKGNHEDFDFLAGREGQQVLPDLTYLGNGTTREIGDLRVGGIGGCYGPSDFNSPAEKLAGKARAHFTQDECARQPACDVLLFHDAPGGIAITKRTRGGTDLQYASTAAGLADVAQRIRPKIVFFGHHHTSIQTEIHGVPCIGLNLVGRAGHLVAIELGRATVRILGFSPFQSHIA